MRQVLQDEVFAKNSDKIQTSRTMTIKGKKNSKVKIISNKKKHELWGNTYRRKRQMSEFFSDSAFGSQSDTLIELIKARSLGNGILLKKYGVRLVIDSHEYKDPPFDTDKLAFMQDPG